MTPAQRASSLRQQRSRTRASISHCELDTAHPKHLPISNVRALAERSSRRMVRPGLEMWRIKGHQLLFKMMNKHEKCHRSSSEGLENPAPGLLWCQESPASRTMKNQQQTMTNKIALKIVCPDSFDNFWNDVLKQETAVSIFARRRPLGKSAWMQPNWKAYLK